MKTMHVRINSVELDFHVEGETIYGADEVLIETDDNLLANLPYNVEGYGIFPFLDAEIYAQLKAGITQLIADYLTEAGAQMDKNFRLEQYHTYANSDALHTYVVKKIQKGIPFDYFPIEPSKIENRIGELLGFKVTKEHIGHYDSFSIRVVRPNRLSDNNPPHRDVWLDRLRNAVNIYAPMAGSNENSALPMIPGSHHWKESEIERTAVGASVNGAAYTVPCVVGSKYGLEMVRPNPGLNEVCLFSPYLIHGGGYNLNTDTTRVSLEMRFWRI